MDSDILHNGGLENLKNYKIFRRRYPKKENLPVRTLTDWYISEIPSNIRNSNTWICLIGIYKDTLIRTSEVTSVISSYRICTANCIYVLNQPSKVLDFPFKGIERYFINGFPNNWEELVMGATARKVLSQVKSTNDIKNEYEIECDTFESKNEFESDLNHLSSQATNKSGRVLRSSLKAANENKKISVNSTGDIDNKYDSVTEKQGNTEKNTSKKSLSLKSNQKKKSIVMKTDVSDKAFGIPLDETKKDNVNVISQGTPKKKSTSIKRSSIKNSSMLDLADQINGNINDDMTLATEVKISHEAEESKAKNLLVKTCVEDNFLESPALKSTRGIDFDNYASEHFSKSEIGTDSCVIEINSSILSESVLQLNRDVSCLDKETKHVDLQESCLDKETKLVDLQESCPDKLEETHHTNKKRKLSVVLQESDILDDENSNILTDLKEQAQSLTNADVETLEIHNNSPSVYLKDEPKNIESTCNIDLNYNLNQTNIELENNDKELSNVRFHQYSVPIEPPSDIAKPVVDNDIASSSHISEVNLEQLDKTNFTHEKTDVLLVRTDKTESKSEEFLENQASTPGFFEKFDQLDSGIFLQIKKDVLSQLLSSNNITLNSSDIVSKIISVELETSSPHDKNNHDMCQEDHKLIDQTAKLKTNQESDIPDKELCSEVNNTCDGQIQSTLNNVNILSNCMPAAEGIGITQNNFTDIDVAIEVTYNNVLTASKLIPNSKKIEELPGKIPIENKEINGSIANCLPPGMVEINQNNNSDLIFNNSENDVINEQEIINLMPEDINSNRLEGKGSGDSFIETGSSKPKKRKSTSSTLKIFKKRSLKSKSAKKVSEPTICNEKSDRIKNNSLPTIFDDLLTDSPLKRTSVSRQQVSKVLIRRSLSIPDKEASEAIDDTLVEGGCNNILLSEPKKEASLILEDQKDDIKNDISISYFAINETDNIKNMTEITAVETEKYVEQSDSKNEELISNKTITDPLTDNEEHVDQSDSKNEELISNKTITDPLTDNEEHVDQYDSKNEELISNKCNTDFISENEKNADQFANKTEELGGNKCKINFLGDNEKQVDQFDNGNEKLIGSESITNIQDVLTTNMLKQNSITLENNNISPMASTLDSNQADLFINNDPALPHIQNDGPSNTDKVCDSILNCQSNLSHSNADNDDRISESPENRSYDFSVSENAGDEYPVIVNNEKDKVSSYSTDIVRDCENLNNLPIKTVDSLDPNEVITSQKANKTRKRKTLIIMPKRLKGKKAAKK